jgi:hypothetical protein
LLTAGGHTVSDDLVIRLRAWRLTQDGICPTAIQCDCSAAADRIEALERELHAEKLFNASANRYSAVRREALEEAAVVAEKLGKWNDDHTDGDISPDYMTGCAAGAYNAAAAIRALKEK